MKSRRDIPMTNSRKEFQAFQERLALEHNKPLWAFAKGLFIAFIGFNLLMGFMLGTMPLAANIFHHVNYFLILPVSVWIEEMGWEGQVTLFAMQASFTLLMVYITRNYLALIWRGIVMKAVDLKNWFVTNVLKPAPAGPNVKPLKPRDALGQGTSATLNTVTPTSQEAKTPPPKYAPPVVRDTTADTAVVG
jgi:hypothetical protein